jgi:dTMP kinase
VISFSGIDCSGKTTQIELLKKEIESKGKKCEVVWSRGGYTPGMEFIKEKIFNRSKMAKEERIARSERTQANSWKRRLLFVAGLIDMWRFYTFSLRYKEHCGKKVICDRYIWDTYIDYTLRYPEYDLNKSFWWRFTQKTMCKPNPSIALFIPAEESMRRSELKDEPFPETIAVRKRRIERYEEEALKGRWMVKIDAMQPIDRVFEEVMKNVRI